MEDEVWYDIPGFESTHEISNLFRIRSKGYWVDIGRNKRFAPSKVRKEVIIAGYPSVKLRHSQSAVRLHRVIGILFIPNPENKKFINHKDGNKLNYAISNLEWSTRQENEDHAFDTGLKNSTGSANTMAKLNENKVRIIKTLFYMGHINTIKLSKTFKVDRVTIQRIINGKTWQHVTI